MKAKFVSMNIGNEYVRSFWKHFQQNPSFFESPPSLQGLHFHGGKNDVPVRNSESFSWVAPLIGRPCRSIDWRTGQRELFGYHGPLQSISWAGPSLLRAGSHALSISGRCRKHAIRQLRHRVTQKKTRCSPLPVRPRPYGVRRQDPKRSWSPVRDCSRCLYFHHPVRKNEQRVQYVSKVGRCQQKCVIETIAKKKEKKRRGTLGELTQAFKEGISVLWCGYFLPWGVVYAHNVFVSLKERLCKLFYNKI